MSIFRLALTILISLPLVATTKTDADALSASQAQVKAQALTIGALTKAVAKTNVDAKIRADYATEQRTTTAVAAQVAISDQKENAVRVETKTDAAVAGAAAAKSSADAATSAGDRNTNLIYMWGAMGIIIPSLLKFLSDGRLLRSQAEVAKVASAHQFEVNEKLTAIKTQTDGMTEKIAAVSLAQGHAEGLLEARDAGKTGD